MLHTSAKPISAHVIDRCTWARSLSSSRLNRSSSTAKDRPLPCTTHSPIGFARCNRPTSTCCLHQNRKIIPVVVPRKFIQTHQPLLLSQPSPHRTPQPYSVDQPAISHCTQTPDPQQGIEITDHSVRLRRMPPIKPRRA